jgi:hypothetical protein
VVFGGLQGRGRRAEAHQRPDRGRRALTDPKFKPVELVEIEPETPAGYFHYFVERPEVYDRAFKEAEAKFAALGIERPAEADVESGLRRRVG